MNQLFGDRQYLERLFSNTFELDLSKSSRILIFLLPFSIFREFYAVISIRSFLIWLTIRATSLVIILLTWLAIRKGLGSLNQREFSVIEIASIGAFGGLLSSMAGNFLVHSLGAIGAESDLARIVQDSITAAILLPIICVISQTARRYEYLQNSISQAKIERMKADLLSDSETLEVIERFVDSQRLLVISMIQRYAKNDIQGLLEIFREISRKLEIRALRAVRIELPSITFWMKRKSGLRFMVQSIRAQEISPSLFTLIFGSVILIDIYPFSSSGLFATAIPVTFIAIYVPLILSAKMLNHRKRFRLASTLGLSGFIILIINTIATFLTSERLTGIHYFLRIILLAYIYSFIYILGHTAQVTILAREILEVMDIEQIDRSAVSQWLYTAEIAAKGIVISGFIHRKVQSLFLIESAARTNPNESITDLQVQKLIDEVNQLYAQIFFDEKDSNRAFNEVVAKTVEPWKRVMTVNLELVGVSGDALGGSILDERIPAILDDALSNAFRHGKASIVWIEISCINQHQVRISIENNGESLNSPLPGLGFLNFTRIAMNNWSLENTEQGVKLEITLDL